MSTGELRHATPADFAALAVIAEAGDSHADDAYLGFVRDHGTLLVDVAGGEVVAFGGVIGIGDGITMLTDLFVAPDHRGRGTGGRLLDQLFAGAERRMTFSSQHAHALPAYRRSGMQPSWQLLYLRGLASGGSAAPEPAPWTGTRPELVDHFRSIGATIDARTVVLRNGETAEILRLQGDDAVGAFTDVIEGLPVGTIVTCCVPEWSPVVAHARALGFEVFDHDTFCSTPGITFPDNLHCVHAGLV